MKLKAEIIDNESQKILEESLFDSQESCDAWLAYRQTMDNYGPEFERSIEVTDVSAEYNKRLEVQDRADDRAFGLWIIDVIAAYNKKHFDQAKMITIFSTPSYVAIILGLLTGGLEATRDAIALIGPGLYPADFVTQIVTALDGQIAKTAPDEEEQTPTEGEPSSEPV